MEQYRPINLYQPKKEILNLNRRLAKKRWKIPFAVKAGAAAAPFLFIAVHLIILWIRRA